MPFYSWKHRGLARCEVPHGGLGRSLRCPEGEATPVCRAQQLGGLEAVFAQQVEGLPAQGAQGHPSRLWDDTAHPRQDPCSSLSARAPVQAAAPAAIPAQPQPWPRAPIGPEPTAQPQKVQRIWEAALGFPSGSAAEQ